VNEVHRSGWSRLDWAALAVLGGGAALVRLAGLSRPVGLVFDEIFYAQNACRYVIGTPDCGIDQLASRAHPPLGNWIIGLGIKLFGYDEFGWRVMSAVAGTVGVLLLYLLIRRLLRSARPVAGTLGAFAAAALLAGDFLHLVQSRVAMLDVFVTTFVIAAVLFAVLDRDRRRDEQTSGSARRFLSALALHRPWRLATGVALGAAVAVKWSGAYLAIGLIPLIVAWEIAARRRPDDPDATARPWGEAIWKALREEAPRSVVLLGIVPVLVYLASYIGRMPGELIGLPWQEGTVWRGIWEHQQAMLRFHTQLLGDHPYESPPWAWLLLKRPVAYFFSDEAGTYREILALGSPLAWLVAVAGFGWAGVQWIRSGWSVWRPELVMLVAAFATYLPWLVLQGDRNEVFIWYILPTLPFLYGAAGLMVAWGWQWLAGRAATVVVAVGVVAMLVFFFPVLTALPVSPDGWRARMWLTDCARPGAPTLELPDDEINSGPPPAGWCWI
jgi:dolichyl-phosphate-mannose-protein mannosyltransferase